MNTRIRFLPQPLFGQLVEVSPALELPVSDEEVMLHLTHHAFVLALGAWASRLAGLRGEPIVAGQIQEDQRSPRRIDRLYDCEPKEPRTVIPWPSVMMPCTILTGGFQIGSAGGLCTLAGRREIIRRRRSCSSRC
jgi:hypothetical protein